MKSRYSIPLCTLALVLVIHASTGTAAVSWQIMDTGYVTNDLYAVWGIADDDILSAGEDGIILYCNDGTSWGEYDSGTIQHLYAIWGDISGIVIAAGEAGRIVSLEGPVFSPMQSPTSAFDIYGLWGASDSEVFGVGQNGYALFFDGTSWETLSSPMGFNLTGVWGSDAENVFAVGEAGTILHYGGYTWEEVAGVPTISDLNAIWGSSASDIYAVGEAGTILHYDGSTWESMAGPTVLDLTCLWGSADDDIFAAGELNTLIHYDGDTWETIGIPLAVLTDIHAIWGSSSGRLYLAGDTGITLLYERDDHIQPEVIATDPEQGETGVPTSTQIRFLLPETMDRETINTSTLTLTSGAAAVPGEVTYSGRVATFTPDDNLDYATQYTATVSTGARDLSGNALRQAFSVTFTTEATPGEDDDSGGGCFLQSARHGRDDHQRSRVNPEAARYPSTS